MKSAKVDATTILVSDLHEYPINPNEQDSATFANLVEEIASDGFGEPLVVVPRTNIDPGAPGYTVVSGNHRLKAVKQLGYAAVDCVVQDWDAETCKIKVVRRNNVRGKTNAAKFTQLVDSISGLTNDQIVEAMAFRSIDEFADLYNRQEVKPKKVDTETPYEHLIDGLSLILNQLFNDYGHTIPHGFMYFMWGSQFHLSILSNARTKEVLNKLCEECVERGLDINDALGAVLSVGLDNLNLDDALELNKHISRPGDASFIPILEDEDE